MAHKLDKAEYDARKAAKYVSADDLADLLVAKGGISEAEKNGTKKKAGNK